uniref:Protein FAM189A2 n=1 Tax=Mola mola TaxID=94237 RepID=A0A3Q3VL11_MOLML
MLENSVIPLPHIYGARIKGVEVFCPLEPPPPYEAVAGSSANAVTQVKSKLKSFTMLTTLSSTVQSSSDAPLAPSPRTTESSTQTSQPTLSAPTQGQITMRRGNNNSRMPRRPRPSSMVDYQSYQHTQQLVRKILEQPAAQGLAPEVQELMESIRSVLQSDQEHMEEAVRCASYIEQVLIISTFPRPLRRKPGLLHLQSCGDLSSFTCAALQSSELRRNRKKVGSRRPHSLIEVFRETVL